MKTPVKLVANHYHTALQRKVQIANKNYALFLSHSNFSSVLEDLPLNKKKIFVKQLKEFQILNEREKNEF